jgi:formate-dependent nitrite reductase cytochrome c552 subunit
MKNGVLLIGTILFALILGLASCEGDEGPIGPAGPTGPTGSDGIAGTTNCVQCHGSSQKITAKLFQWEHSVHATGGNFDHNAPNCAICHTSQGFLERIATGATQTAATIQDPLPQNCYTCHKIHTTYTEADWAFTQTQPVTLWVGGQTLDFGKANLCISCHQSRTYTPALPDPNTGGTVNIQTTRYGTHHGPQGVMLPGLNGYEVPGPVPYENSAHTMLLANNFKNACITCHMGTAQGVESGGHTFRVISEEGVINTAACVECHPVAADLNALVDDRQAQIEAKLAELEALLVARGKYNATTGQNTKGDYTGHEAGALFNFKFVEEDKSRGVHNFKYAYALLTNSIASLQ